MDWIYGKMKSQIIDAKNVYFLQTPIHQNTLFFAQFWLKKPQTLVGSIEFLYFYFFKENRRFMENSVSPHQVAEAFYAAFKKLPSAVREEVKTMIETPLRTKKKKYADDTEYFMDNPVMHKQIMKSIQNVRERKNITVYTPEEWEVFVKETLEKAER